MYKIIPIIGFFNNKDSKYGKLPSQFFESILIDIQNLHSNVHIIFIFV